jgi:hypothetical protein
MIADEISKNIQASEAEVEMASRELADEEARSAVAIADGGQPRDLGRFEQAVEKAKTRARTLREALAIVKRREEREQETARRREQHKARELLRQQAHALATQLDEVLEAGRELRTTSARAARLGTVSIGAGGASPEAKHTIATWRDRLRAL